MPKLTSKPRWHFLTLCQASCRLSMLALLWTLPCWHFHSSVYQDLIPSVVFIWEYFVFVLALHMAAFFNTLHLKIVSKLNLFIINFQFKNPFSFLWLTNFITKFIHQTHNTCNLNSTEILFTRWHLECDTCHLC